MILIAWLFVTTVLMFLFINYYRSLTKNSIIPSSLLQQFPLYNERNTDFFKQLSNLLKSHQLTVSRFPCPSSVIPEYAPQFKKVIVTDQNYLNIDKKIYDIVNVTKDLIYYTALNLFKHMDIEWVIIIKKNVQVDWNYLTNIIRFLQHQNMILFSDIDNHLIDVIIMKNNAVNILRIQMILQNPIYELDILNDEIISKYKHEQNDDVIQDAWKEFYALSLPMSFTQYSICPDKLLFTEGAIGKSSFKTITDIERQEVADYEQRIPFHLFQTFEINIMKADDYSKSVHRWITLNPEYNYYFFNTSDQRVFIRDHFPAFVLKSYDSLIPGAYRADLWRYCVIYVKGGVYADLRTSPNTRLKHIIQPSDDFVIPRDFGLAALWQGFFACSIRHPIMEMCIHWICNDIMVNKYYDLGLELTGPACIGKIFNLFMDRYSYSTIHHGLYTKFHKNTRIIYFQYVHYRQSPYISNKNGGKDIYSKINRHGIFWDYLRGSQYYVHSNAMKRVYHPNIFPTVHLVISMSEFKSLYAHPQVNMFCKYIIFIVHDENFENNRNADVLYSKSAQRSDLLKLVTCDPEWVIFWSSPSFSHAFQSLQRVRNLIYFENIIDSLPYNKDGLTLF